MSVHLADYFSVPTVRPDNATTLENNGGLAVIWILELTAHRRCVLVRYCPNKLSIIG